MSTREKKGVECFYVAWHDMPRHMEYEDLKLVFKKYAQTLFEEKGKGSEKEKKKAETRSFETPFLLSTGKVWADSLPTN